MTDYVDNKKFYDAFVKHRERTDKARQEGQPDPRLPDSIGRCFLLIAENVAKRGNFAQYSYRDEMVGDAIENCVTAANNFDPSRGSNPFSYFTQVATWAMIRRIEKEKKQTYVKYAMFQNMNVMGELFAGEGDDFRSNGQTINEVADQVVANWEETRRNRDLRAAEKKRKKGLEVLFDEEPTPVEVPVDVKVKPRKGRVSAG